MKKIFYTMALLSAVNAVNAQGFLGKLKNKVTNSVSKPAQQDVSGQARVGNTNATSQAPDGSVIKYTNPSAIGTMLKTFTEAEINAHPDGFDMWFPNGVKVVNNQLVADVAESNSAMYSLNGIQFQKTGATPPSMNGRADIKNGSEIEFFSKDFTQTDFGNAMLKKGHNVSSGAIPGKPEQVYTFNGKVIGSFMMAQIAHNADSTAVAIAGMSVTGGVKYHMTGTNGIPVDYPKAAGVLPLISPNGKVTAAWNTIAKQAYVCNGTTVTVNDVSNNNIWLRNSGNIFYVPVSSNQKSLERNGQLFINFNSPVDMKLVFISADEKSMAWGGYRGLYFSDGTVYENASAPTRVIIDNKEVIVFLDVDTGTGNLYLCKHAL
ncbi:hypothetical protein [Mucilaginibacter sp.]|uniref:hypothetical protein n=1 Tax=Mucilaginibacter sp. TaxID=1882438 RepID=UPI003D10EEE4